MFDSRSAQTSARLVDFKWTLAGAGMMRIYGKHPNHPNVKLFAFKGELRTICEWAKRFGLPYTTIQQRLRRGVALDAPKSRAGRPPRAAR